MSAFNSKAIKALYAALRSLGGTKSSVTESYTLGAGLPDKLKVRITSIGAVRITLDTSITGCTAYINAINDVNSGKTGTGSNAMRDVLTGVDKFDEDKATESELRDYVKKLKKDGKKARKDTLQFTIVDEDDI